MLFSWGAVRSEIHLQRASDGRKPFRKFQGQRKIRGYRLFAAEEVNISRLEAAIAPKELEP